MKNFVILPSKELVQVGRMHFSQLYASIIQWATRIDHRKKDGGMYILPESEIVQKSKLMSFEEQSEYIKLFSH